MKLEGHPEHKSMSDAKLDDSSDFSMKDMRKVTSRRETHGMREGWYRGVHGLFTALRVLPPDLSTN